MSPGATSVNGTNAHESEGARSSMIRPDGEIRKSPTDQAVPEAADAKAEEPKASDKPKTWLDLFSYSYEVSHDGRFQSESTQSFWDHATGHVNSGRGLELRRPKDAGPPELLFTSRMLCEFFRRATNGFQFHECEDEGSRIIIRYPYVPLFHCLDRLVEIAEAETKSGDQENEEVQAIKRLCTEGEISKLWQPIQESLKRGEVSALHLWSAYKPGETLIIKDVGMKDTVTIMRLVSVLKDRSNASKKSFKFTNSDWVFKAKKIFWDGNRYWESVWTTEVTLFDGYKKFSDLKVTALRYHPDAESVLDAVRERGLKYQSLCDGSSEVRTMSYTGPAMPMFVSVGGSKITRPEPIHVSGRMVIDPKALPKASRQASLHAGYTSKVLYVPEHVASWRDDMIFLDNDQSIEVELPDPILMPSTYPAYSIDDQEWVNVRVEHLENIEWKRDTFKTLQLSDTQKDMLLCLLRSHTQQVKLKRTTDIIDGKGNGLVMLFYGPPGTGKTLTAEAISEWTGRPLYKISLGDIARYNIDSVIEHIFHCAYSWNAILLIDEAEVILETRTLQGGEQNRWVSVFLRKVEYFKGILVLTTNLVQAIDPAFQSRISVGIEFQSLDDDARLVIWTKFINRLSNDTSNKTALLKCAPEWAREDMNARQIRNVILTAESMVLGRSGGRRMGPEDVQTIFDMQVRFNQGVGEQKGRRKNLSSVWGH